MKPPVAPKKEHTHSEHGVKRNDPYYWMRNRSDEAVLSYLKAENHFTQQKLSHLNTQKEAMYKELLSRIQETDSSAPYFDAPYWYYSRTEEGKAYGIYCRKYMTLKAKEEIFLDVNLLAEGKEYLDLGEWTVSDDHRYLAYSLDETGRPQIQSPE